MIHSLSVSRRRGPVFLIPGLLAFWCSSSFAQNVSALGRIEPEHGVITVAVASTTHAVSGSVIRELLIQEGEWVEAGQLLAITDSTEMLRHHQDMAERELSLALIAKEAAESRAEEACTHARVAENEAARRANLLERGLASAEEAEHAQGEAEARAASCTAAGANIRVAEASTEVARARAALRAAEVERSQVRAPSAGRVLEVHARPGELAAAAGLLDLGRTDRMMAVAEVYETDIARVAVGQAARIDSDVLAAALSGTVERIRGQVRKKDVIGTDPAARKDARIVEVEIRLDDSAPVASLTNLQVEIVIQVDS